MILTLEILITIMDRQGRDESCCTRSCTAALTDCQLRTQWKRTRQILVGQFLFWQAGTSTVISKQETNCNHNSLSHNNPSWVSKLHLLTFIPSYGYTRYTHVVTPSAVLVQVVHRRYDYTQFYCGLSTILLITHAAAGRLKFVLSTAFG